MIIIKDDIVVIADSVTRVSRTIRLAILFESANNGIFDGIGPSDFCFKERAVTSTERESSCCSAK
jgi:hypothetical protein